MRSIAKLRSKFASDAKFKNILDKYCKDQNLVKCANAPRGSSARLIQIAKEEPQVFQQIMQRLAE